jgi:hypothetical protein
MVNAFTTGRHAVDDIMLEKTLVEYELKEWSKGEAQGAAA